jgi:apolipoprotein N-acyltransferase
MSPETTILGQYDKIILTPFGEYIPFQSSILFFLDKWVEGIGDFAPGTTRTVFSLPFGEFGVLICYEGVFPDLARRFVNNGATLLINMTNDAWFGETSAPYQHLAMEAMRAVENRVPLVRAANTGISAIVGIDGQVQAQTALSETAFLAEEIAWPQVTSVYTQHGDWFAKLCTVSVLVMLGYSYIKASSRRNGGNGYARRNEREVA